LLLGVYMHGLAGDLAEIKIGEQSLIASDIVENIPNMIHSLQKRSTT
jgi:NAD(P)H-hydrate repair Nnr-like enzyme with NAD(P)H-hydrate dehydratase domain